jgi:2-polyprenyl-6-hydroxyphenyl methylase/3-demethylubiquinone-9 3-methyltransferase
MIDNEFYDRLGERWYDAQDDPVALLRAEAALRNPAVLTDMRALLGDVRGRRVLDVGCGAGFLTNFLAAAGCVVSGLDQSADSLDVARRHDATGSVEYRVGDAFALPYADGSFDCVCMMDFLEHVDPPWKAVAEAARVLRAGGLFYFYTFNRTLAARLLVIKAVEIFVRNTPPNMHVYELFVTPDEMRSYCDYYGLRVEIMKGARPRLDAAFWKLAWTGVVPRDFSFTFTRSLAVGYWGRARKA